MISSTQYDNPYVNLAKDITDVISPTSTGIVIALVMIGIGVRNYLKTPGNSVKTTMENIERINLTIASNQEILKNQSSSILTLTERTSIANTNDGILQSRVTLLEGKMDRLIENVEKSSASSSTQIVQLRGEIRELFNELRLEIAYSDQAKKQGN